MYCVLRMAYVVRPKLFSLGAGLNIIYSLLEAGPGRRDIRRLEMTRHLEIIFRAVPLLASLVVSFATAGTHILRDLWSESKVPGSANAILVVNNICLL